MNVLVTGAAGFIGSHFVERLLSKSDHRVTCIDNFCDYYPAWRKRENVREIVSHPRVHFVEGDVGDRAVVSEIFDRSRPDVIVHAAAHAGVTPSVKAPEKYLDNNIRSTLTLLEQVRETPCKRLIFISSSTVYGRGCEAPFQEDGALGVPASPYGVSKRAAELLCLNYHYLHRTPIVIIRPFSVYGPRLRPDLALSVFADRILRGLPLHIYGDGSVRRDFTHVSDICAGLHAALDAPGIDGHCINLGHCDPVEIRTVVELLCKELGEQARIEYEPSREEDLLITHADLTTGRRLLDYCPAVAFETGLRDFAKWYESVHNRSGAPSANASHS